MWLHSLPGPRLKRSFSPVLSRLLVAYLSKLIPHVYCQSEREKLQKQLKDKTAALKKAKERQSELSVLSRDRRIKQDTMRGLEAEIVKMKRNKVRDANRPQPHRLEGVGLTKRHRGDRGFLSFSHGRVIAAVTLRPRGFFVISSGFRGRMRWWCSGCCK